MTTQPAGHGGVRVTPVHYHPHPPDRPTLDCPRCGSVVVDRAVHERHHEGLARVTVTGQIPNPIADAVAEVMGRWVTDPHSAPSPEPQP